MRKPKLIVDSSNDSDSLMVTHSQGIVTKMTGNAHFPTPVPSLADVTTAITDLETSITGATSGDHAAVQLKEQKRKTLDDLLHQLALYVETESAGDPAVMLGAGFKISKDPSPVGPLPKPTGFKVQSVGKGEMKLSVDKLDGADHYLFEYRQTTATAWEQKISTKSRLLLTGLESGKEYLFRVSHSAPVI